MRPYAQTPAYQGVRVLELAQGVAAPYSTMMLAQNGAEVLKVEPVGAGDWARGIGRRVGDHSAESIAVNRGKKSIALNLKSEAGKAAALKLASRADVVVDNYRPGVLERLGLDYDTIRATTDRLRRDRPQPRPSRHRYGDAGLYRLHDAQPRR